MKSAMRRLVPMGMLLAFAAPAPALDRAVHIWQCDLDENTGEAQVEELATEWLKAVRALDGGKDATLDAYFPVAVNNTGHNDVLLVMSVPTFADWGRFWDAYEDGTAAAMAEDREIDKLDCTDSSLWEAHTIGAAQ